MQFRYRDGTWWVPQDRDVEQWKLKYSCDVEAELENAAEWTHKYPKRAPVRMMGRFCRNWLAKASGPSGRNTLRAPLIESTPIHEITERQADVALAALKRIRGML